MGNWRWPDHWQRHLATAARRAGHVVSYQQFPNPETPTFADWQALLVAETQLLEEVGSEAGELLFVGHSLGSLNFLFGVQHDAFASVFDRVLLVAPADPELLPRLEVDPLSFDENFLTKLARRAKSLQIVGSDDDPWIPKGVQESFGEPLKVSPLIVPGAKHFSLNDGWGRWQGVIDWVENPAADLTKR